MNRIAAIALAVAVAAAVGSQPHGPAVNTHNFRVIQIQIRIQQWCEHHHGCHLEHR
jgi:hypothetical protein